MKIIDKIRALEKPNAAGGSQSKYFSLEFFPPKTDEGVSNLYLRMDRMTQMEPLFIDVTWGAGGSTRELTMAISEYSKTYFGVDVLMHLTCTSLTIAEIKSILKTAREVGIQNILVCIFV